jgi:hypothetical protein
VASVVRPIPPILLSASRAETLMPRYFLYIVSIYFTYYFIYFEIYLTLLPILLCLLNAQNRLPVSPRGKAPTTSQTAHATSKQHTHDLGAKDGKHLDFKKFDEKFAKLQRKYSGLDDVGMHLFRVVSFSFLYFLLFFLSKGCVLV